jgi:hypothetical protein
MYKVLTTFINTTDIFIKDKLVVIASGSLTQQQKLTVVVYSSPEQQHLLLGIMVILEWPLINRYLLTVL